MADRRRVEAVLVNIRKEHVGRQLLERILVAVQHPLERGPVVLFQRNGAPVPLRWGGAVGRGVCVCVCGCDANRLCKEVGAGFDVYVRY